MATTGVNGLYPPVFQRAYMPAFVGNTATIYFTISYFNKRTDLNDYCQIEIRNQKTNKSVIKTDKGILFKQIQSAEDGTGRYYVTISVDTEADIKIDEFYKVQIRFLTTSVTPNNESDYSWIQTNLTEFSEWSSVCIIKRIHQPRIILKNWSTEGDSTLDTTFYLSDISLSGSIIFVENDEETKDQTETIKSYQIFLYDMDGAELERSQLFEKNSADQENNFYYELKYNFPANDNISTYTLKINATTNNLYSFSQEFPFQLSENFYKSFENATIAAVADDKDGFIKVYLDFTNEVDASINENLFIRRASSKDKFKTWEIVHISLLNSGSETYEWEDWTVQPGIWYIYSFYFKNKQGLKTSSVETEQSVLINPQDMFLTTKDYQLKIRFDPQISSFSHTLSESLTSTLGAQYPFVRRNGKVDYRTFQLSGTISAFIDLRKNKMKATYEDFFTPDSDADRDILSKYLDYNSENNITMYNDYIGQRFFRDKVIDFLYADDVKLFRSVPQGNILVRLMNISLTPNNTLGRLIYSFSCTANEIDECTFKNYNKYGIQTIGEENYPDSYYYLKYGEIESPSSILSLNTTVSTSNTTLLNIKKYFPTTSGALKTLIEKKINVNSNYSEYYSFEGLRYLKIELDSQPYPIRKTSSGYDYTLDTTAEGDYFLGHIIYIDGSPAIIGPNGTYEIADFDLEDLDTIQYADSNETSSNTEDNLSSSDSSTYDYANSQGINIKDIYFANSKQTGRISYVAVVKGEMKSGFVPVQISRGSKLGQYWGVLTPETSLYSSIIKKYTYQIITDTQVENSLIQNFSQVFIQARPGAAFFVRESSDTLANTSNEENDNVNIHKINDTGFLAFNGDDTIIKDIIYKGIYLRENVDVNKDNVINMGDDEWMDTGIEIESLSNIRKPIRNGVYHLSQSLNSLSNSETSIKEEFCNLFQQYTNIEISSEEASSLLSDLSSIINSSTDPYDELNNFIDNLFKHFKATSDSTNPVFLPGSYASTMLKHDFYEYLENARVENSTDYIYYMGQWYPFNNGIVSCPCDGIIDYYFSLLKNYYTN